MSKICAKCSKAVYPLEELKCLDKVWHKGCFRCWECNMTLNMKNYKGYDKKPYCSAHYPQTKATVVADTPELQRLARNTEIQSQVKYHEEFEKKIKGSKIQIPDDPETQRVKQLSSVVSQVEYKGIREKTGSIESRRQSLPPMSEKKDKWPLTNSSCQSDDPRSPFSDGSTSTSVVYTFDGKVEAPRQKRIGSIADYDPVNDNYGSLTQGYNPVSRMSQSQEWEETVLVTSPATPSTAQFLKKDVGTRKLSEFGSELPEPSIVETENGQDIVLKHENEDVFHDDECSKVAIDSESAHSSADIIHEDLNAFNTGKSTFETEDEEKKLGSVEKILSSPLKRFDEEHCMTEKTTESYIIDTNAVQMVSLPSASSSFSETKNESPTHTSDPDVESDDKTSSTKYKREENSNDSEKIIHAFDDATVAESKPLKGTFVALYDYEAQDSDEVGFKEGDHITDCELIDAGWMTGTVLRTGEKGMLPSNYVEQVI